MVDTRDRDGGTGPAPPLQLRIAQGRLHTSNPILSMWSNLHGRAYILQIMWDLINNSLFQDGHQDFISESMARLGRRTWTKD